MMTARNIDSEGFWYNNGNKINLLTNLLPVPESLMRNGNELEYVLFIVQANNYISECSECNSIIGDDMIILVLETVRLFPAQCCNEMHWFVEEEPPLPTK